MLNRDWSVAVHEAGHCLGDRLAGAPIVKATVVPNSKYDGHVTSTALVGFTDGAMRSLLGRASEMEFGFDGDPYCWEYSKDCERAVADIKHMLKLDKSQAWSERTGIWENWTVARAQSTRIGT